MLGNLFVMIGLVLAAVIVPEFLYATWNSGFYFENFGKGSPMENYLESLAKV